MVPRAEEPLDRDVQGVGRVQREGDPVRAFRMEEAGDRWWPFAGGVYFLHGIKRVPGMRIITPKWKSVEVKKKALAAVPHKTNGHDDAMAARTNHMAGDPQ